MYDTKVRTKEVTKVRARAKNDSLKEYVFSEYRDILSQEKELAEKKKEILESIKAKMEDRGITSLEGEAGKFMLIERKTLSWTLESLKENLGRQWTSFVTPDSKLLKAKEGMEEFASVEVKEVVTFIKK